MVKKEKSSHAREFKQNFNSFSLKYHITLPWQSHQKHNYKKKFLFLGKMRKYLHKREMIQIRDLYQ